MVDSGVTFRAAHDRLDPRDQLAPVERLGQEVVGAKAQALDLVIELGQTRQDQDRGAHPGRAQPAQHFVAVDVGQHQIQNDDVVIVKLADLQTILAEVGGIADEAFPLQHQLDARSHRCIVLNQQNAH